MSLQTKRNDLQCWRALSILAVLLFHIWPKKFPNGYLGVDITSLLCLLFVVLITFSFFVLSGYLMAYIYSFDGNFLASVTDFYCRRIKRILPVYLVIIFLTLSFLAKQVFYEDYKLIVEDSKWAIVLATNLQDLLKKREYFETEASFRFFRHCWSLAVEMQFYLIFPFIAIFRSRISQKNYQLVLILILIASAYFQLTSTNSTVQYESLFCRIWQFSAGMLAQTISLMAPTSVPCILLLTVFLILFCTMSLPRMLASFVTIALTTVIISMSRVDFYPYKTLFHHPKIIQHIVILGDISYILYLIHWPIITYAQFISAERTFSYFDGFLLLMSSIFLSNMAHRIIEKPLLKLCNNYLNLIICLTILIASSLHIPQYLPKQMSFETLEKPISSNLTLEFYQKVLDFSKPLILPEKWTIINDIEFALKIRGEHMGGAFICNERKEILLKNKKKLFYCDVLGNGNGTLVGLSIGNSFSMNIVSAVSSNPMFKRVINVFGNAASFPNHDDFEIYLVEKIIKAIKPDVTFLVQLYQQKYLFNTPIDQIKDHNEFQHWNNVLKVIQNYTTAIIMNKEQIVYPYEISQDFIRKKLYGLFVESRIKNPPKSQSVETWLTSLNCTKCQFFSYREAFCDGGYCNTIDLASGLPLFRDTMHISPVGIRYVKPFIDKAINKALKIEKIKK